MLQGPKTGEIAIKTGGIIPNLLPAKPHGKISVRNSAGGKISLQKNRLDFFFPSLSLSPSPFSRTSDSFKIQIKFSFSMRFDLKRRC